MSEPWEGYCDKDDPILATLTAAERRHIEQELDGCGPVTKATQRGKLVRLALSLRSAREPSSASD